MAAIAAHPGTTRKGLATRAATAGVRCCSHWFAGVGVARRPNRSSRPQLFPSSNCQRTNVDCSTYSLRYERTAPSHFLAGSPSSLPGKAAGPFTFLRILRSGIRENSAVGTAGLGSAGLCLAEFSVRGGLAEFSRILLRGESQRKPGRWLAPSSLTNSATRGKPKKAWKVAGPFVSIGW